MMEDRFKETLDSIHPSEGARERMLRNIESKHNQNMNTSKAEDQTEDSPRKAQTKKYKPIMIAGLSVAACLVVALAFFIGRTVGSKNDNKQLAVNDSESTQAVTGMDAQGESEQGTHATGLIVPDEEITAPTEVIAPSYYYPQAEETSLDAISGPQQWKDLLDIDVTFPEEASEVQCSTYQGYKTECYFVFGSYGYSLNVVKGDTIPKEIFEGTEEYTEFHPELGGGVYMYYDENGDPTGKGQVCWTKDGQSYCIVASFGTFAECLAEVGDAFIAVN